MLLERRLPAGAYYLAGYAVECAIKAGIAKATKRHDFPDKNRSAQSYTHDLPTLLRLSGLQPAFDAATTDSPALAQNWAIVKNWRETCRYDCRIDMDRARELYRAVTTRRSGVLAWLRQHC